MCYCYHMINSVGTELLVSCDNIRFKFSHELKYVVLDGISLFVFVGSGSPFLNSKGK